MSNIVWQVIVFILGLGLLFIGWSFLEQNNDIRAESFRVDCLIRSANIDSSKFDKANCYHILDYKSGYKNVK